MGDPPRMRSSSVGLESLLLRSAPKVEPPPSAEDEVWRRIEVLTAAGAVATATGLGASAAASGSKIATKAVWLAVLRWGAVLAVGLPVGGAATHWALHRGATPPAKVAVATRSIQAPRAPDDEAPAEPPTPSDSALLVPTIAPAITPAPYKARSVAASSLKKESLSLGAARAELASGDARGALDEVARLGAEFPRGRLVQEREVLAIDCLTALGDREHARARGRAFLDCFPTSPYLAHVREIVER